jgi:hypothetical protein
MPSSTLVQSSSTAMCSAQQHASSLDTLLGSNCRLCGLFYADIPRLIPLLLLLLLLLLQASAPRRSTSW